MKQNTNNPLRTLRQWLGTKAKALTGCRCVALMAMLMLGGTEMALAQSMTDEQVITYVTSSLAAGKDQRTIALELARRGVTEEQALRVKRLYERRLSEGSIEAPDTDTRTRSRLRQSNTTDNESAYIGQQFDINRPGGGTPGNRQRTPSDNRRVGNRLNTNDEQQSQQANTIEMQLWEEFADPETVEEELLPVYGRNIFNSELLSFEPSVNMATPRNYTFGPGDEVIIDVWGDNEVTIRQTISPDGNITIDGLGLVTLAGKTVESADQYLRQRLSRIYAGLNANDGVNDMEVSLGQSRTIQVHVMGEVKSPGSYMVSSFATLFHALYQAGGVGEIGSLRNIQLVRNGRTIATLDVYDFIMNGNLKKQVMLEEGDVVIVPAYEQLVTLTGMVKRPMRYEMRHDETLKQLFAYAGGLSNKAYTKSIRVMRENDAMREVCTVRKDQFGTFHTMDGDQIDIEAVIDRYVNRLTIRGAVYHPGDYQLGEVNTIKQLIAAADGLMGDAFLARAVLQRENADLTREVMSVDIAALMNGTINDIPLQNNDILYIPSIHDLKDIGTVKIHGEVARPGEYVFSAHMTIEDLVIEAGGLKESASTERVDVTRRIRDPKSEVETSLLSQTFRFALKDGFIIDGTPGFELEPYDEVYIRKSPAYSDQNNVTIKGEVLYPGEYGMTHKTTRLSDIIEMAGGLTSHSYIKGASLIRKFSDEEMARQKSALAMVKNSKDSLSADMLNISPTYSIGIDLTRALEHKGSNADIVLRDGDVIEIPEYVNTVKISGAVMHPNTVTYNEGMTVKDYIIQAGGYGNRARKNRAYSVCMNGQVKKARSGSRTAIEPGCELIIPMKEESHWTAAQTMSVATTSASIGTMIASIANMLRQ